MSTLNENKLAKSKEHLPEITLKAAVLSVLLIILLSASNVYLGLKAGTTISTSIPAVVIALAIFRLFKKHNILEINTVQTAASVGEGVVAGLIFTIPALVIIHFWQGFNYWETVLIGFLGGVLGILISIPVRKALLHEKTLHFPEGTAIAQVMKVGTEGSSDIKPIALGGLIGALIVLFSSGFRILAEDFQYWAIKGKILFGFGYDFSPALIAAGYICGINLAIGMIIGLILAWIIGVPFLSMHFGLPYLANPTNIANNLWSHYIRYIGIGTMLIGGIWTLITLLKPIVCAIKSSIHALHDIKVGQGHKIANTDRDIPINYVFWGMIVIVILIAIKLACILLPNTLGIALPMRFVTLLICIVYLFILSFVLVPVGGYFAGLVGASNSPVSGLIIASLLFLSIIILTIIGSTQTSNQLHHIEAATASGIVIMICAFIGCAATTGTECSQIAKVGSLVGGTPWKQQVVLIGSMAVVALIVPLLLSLLFNAYGMAGVFPRAGMPVSQMLPAPQAGLIAAVSQAVFTHQLPWSMLDIGIAIAIVCIVCDEILKRYYNKRLLVLAVGLSIYLPVTLIIPLIIGGLLSYAIQRAHIKKGTPMINDHIRTTKGMHNALFLACGLVAGSTIMGVILAIPIAISENENILRIAPKNFASIAGLLAFLVAAAVVYWIYKVGIKRYPEDK